jgi:hypothetical protein
MLRTQIQVILTTSHLTFLLYVLTRCSLYIQNTGLWYSQMCWEVSSWSMQTVYSSTFSSQVLRLWTNTFEWVVIFSSQIVSWSGMWPNTRLFNSCLLIHNNIFKLKLNNWIMTYWIVKVPTCNLLCQKMKKCGKHRCNAPCHLVHTTALALTFSLCLQYADFRFHLC